MEKLKKYIEEILIKIHQQEIHFDAYSESKFDLQKIISPYKAILAEADFLQIEDLFFNYGPLSHILKNDSIKEVNINSYEDIYIEDTKSYYKNHKHFILPVLYHKFIDHLQKEIQQESSLEKPFVNGHWKGFRIHISHPSVSQNYCVSLRKQISSKVSLASSLSTNILSNKQLNILKTLMLTKKNCILIGETGSGKTSLLSLLLKQYAIHDRCIIIEDCNEIRLPNQKSCKLVTKEAHPPKIPEVNLFQLIKQSLRMRPDRIIFGEVRSEEAKDLLLAFSTGHQGSLSTLHAANPREALYRLEMLISLGAKNWPIDSIRKLIHLSLQNIVLMKRQGQNIFCQGIYKIDSLERFGFTLEQLD